MSNDCGRSFRVSLGFSIFIAFYDLLLLLPLFPLTAFPSTQFLRKQYDSSCASSTSVPNSSLSFNHISKASSRSSFLIWLVLFSAPCNTIFGTKESNRSFLNIFNHRTTENLNVNFLLVAVLSQSKYTYVFYFVVLISSSITAFAIQSRNF